MQDSTVIPKKNKRNTILIGVALGFMMIGLGFWGYEHFIGDYHETTDNAYVQGDIISITPQTGGIVRDVLVQETQVVNQGSVLVRLDDRDAALALEQAKESLALSVRQVVHTHQDLQASDAEVAMAEESFTKAQGDWQRRQSLVTSGAISAEEFQHTKESVEHTRDALLQAKAHRAAVASAIQGGNVETNPSVKLAANGVETALLAYKRCHIIAPCEGIVAKKNIQAGQKVAAGDRIMALVAHHQLWVDANLKETQLAHVRIGQKVILYSDLYGKSSPFQGKVAGISPGTGSVFTLLPAQNASGNWIKIVQRVPVRIALDPKELQERPLRVGLSMIAEIDTHNREGSALGLTTSSPVIAKMYEDTHAQAQVMVAKIIAENR